MAFFSTINETLLFYLGQLQGFFQNDPVIGNIKSPNNPDGVLSGNYLWDPDPNKTRIWITDEEPEDEQKIPFITITGDAGGSQEIDLGQMISEDIVLPDGTYATRYGGIFGGSIDFKIGALSSPERGEVSDLALIATMFRKRIIKASGGSIVPITTRFSGFWEEQWGSSGKVYMAGFSQAININWYYDLPDDTNRIQAVMPRINFNFK